MKKLVSLILCLAMLLSVSIVATAEETPELRTVTVMCKKDFNNIWHTEGNEDNAVYNYFIEQLAARGIKLELDAIDNASFGTAVATRMAAGTDLPDVIASCWDGFSEGDMIKWGQNGLLVNLYDALDQYDDDGSILEFYKTRCPSALGANTAPDGNLYWFSYLVNTKFVDEQNNDLGNVASPHTLSVRTDWLEKADIEYKFFYTPDELYDILVAFQEIDANGNGVKDEVVGIDISNFNHAFAQGFGLGDDLIACLDPVTDEIYTNFDKEIFADYINYMKKLYDNGLYDTTILGSGMKDQMIADNKISVGYEYATWTSWEPTISDPNAEYAAFLLDDDAGENGFMVIGDAAATTYCNYMVTKDCKDLEAVIDLFDYVYTEEYADLCNFGLEGLSYERNELGIPHITYTSEQENNRFEGVRLFNTLGLYVLPCVNISTILADNNYAAVPQYPKKDEFRKFWFYDREMLDKATILYATGVYALPTEEETEVISELENGLYTYASELLSDLILGKKDLANMDEYMTELENLGLRDYIEVQQARHDRCVAAKG